MGKLRGVALASLAMPWLVMLCSCKRPVDPEALRKQLEADPIAQQVTAFALDSLVEDVLLSPRGTYLSARVTQGDKTVLAVIRLSDKSLVVTIGFQQPENVGSYVWASDDRVVISVVAREGSLVSPVNYGELYSIAVTEKQGRLVFGARAGERQVGNYTKKAASSRAWADIIDGLPADPRHILIASRPWPKKKEIHPTLYELDVVRGTQKSLGVSPVQDAWFLTDPDGEIRFAIGTDERGEDATYHRAGRGAEWRPLETLSGFSEKTRPLRMCDRQHVIVLDASGDGLAALFLVDLTTGERREIFQPPEAEVSGLVLEPGGCRIVAVEHQPDYPAYQLVDPEHPLAAMLRELSESLGNAHVRVVDQTTDGSLVLMFAYRDQDPGQYFLVDLPRQAAQHIYSRLQGKLPDPLAEMRPIKLKARDGLQLTGYLSLPPDGSERGLPMVVLPHGGPHATRDSWGYDGLVQMLASQGFAVLQINFRGSGGFGEAFKMAGYRQWGERVQHDIIDATRWVIEQGFAEKDRVCIFGVSFGGYSALQSASLAPDLFRCAIGYAGIYDLNLMFKIGDIQERTSGRTYLDTVLGDDATKLGQMSPAHNADKIRIPVMLAHGGKDERVPIEHAYKMRDALRARGVECEWLEKEYEGHGFMDVLNNIDLYARLIRFLKKHTQPARQPGPAK